jgi:homopolymeric O-antigen transport system permease protein
MQLRDLENSGVAPTIGPRTRSTSGGSRPPGQKLALLSDFLDSLHHADYWVYAGWMDILLRYRATVLGPIWIIAGTGLFVAMIGTLYRRVMLSSHPTYLAHLAIGVILWTLMSNYLVGSCRVYRSSAHLILNGNVRFTDYLFRLLLVNGTLLLHNSLIVVAVFLLTPASLSPTCLALLMTVPLLAAFLFGAAALLSVVGARYPDLGELLQSLLRIAFFITPIVWSPHDHGRSEFIGLFLYTNPFYYLLEIVRSPLIDDRIPWFEIGVVAAAALVVWVLASHVYARGKNYIPLWI